MDTTSKPWLCIDPSGTYFSLLLFFSQLTRIFYLAPVSVYDDEALGTGMKLLTWMQDKFKDLGPYSRQRRRIIEEISPYLTHQELKNQLGVSPLILSRLKVKKKL